MKQFVRTGFARLGVVGVMCVLVPPSSEARDVANSKDHPLVKRFEGSQIVWYAQKSYDALRIALEPVIFNYNEQKFDPYKKLEVEGLTTTIFYALPPGVGTLEAIRNYETELKEKGFEILFSASGEGLERNRGDNIAAEIFGVTPANSNRDHPDKVAHLPAPTKQSPVTWRRNSAGQKPVMLTPRFMRSKLRIRPPR